ncbi:hypothetical protein BD289DRAFT_451351 [Coniella lustricola]|uniref:Peroxin 26 n=1 Tax=Coniella lustricola TaxID=2025994 RepID=A0A2T3AF93_9PEZI|nr:hypothetical protein BD289DRAFT_451351 [Coniella lustricola]
MDHSIPEELSSSHQALSSSISSLTSPTQARHSASYVSKTYRQASTLFLTRRLPEALTTILPLITLPHPTSDDGDKISSSNAEQPSQPQLQPQPQPPTPVAKASRNTRIKVWTLYIAILNAIVALEPEEGKEAFGTQDWRATCAKVRDGEVWEEVVVNGYHGVEGHVDPDVVINLATLLLTHARTQIITQKRLENFLAASTNPDLDHLSQQHFSPPLLSSASASASALRSHSRRHRSPSALRSGADTPRDLNARVKILELYTLHVLVRNSEWDYAREFIAASPVLDEERREAFLQALQSLREDHLEAERLEHEEKHRQEEQLKQDVEEARRLRAENEAVEKRRLDEERARREGSEVDYGIDSSAAGSASGERSKRSRGQGRQQATAGGDRPKTTTQPPRAKSSSTTTTRPPPPPSSSAAAAGAAGPASKKSKAVITSSSSFGARAAATLANVRAMLERMNATLRTDPMLLMRLLAFILGLLLMFGRKNMRERVVRVMATSWNKVKATAGMGVRVSYI